MIRLIVLLVIAPLLALSQIRLSKLEIPSNQVYRMLQTDIIVVDTLILRDSSILQLNRQKKDNYIHATHLVVGTNAKIFGQGDRGDSGRNGVKGHTIDGPCLDGTPGLGGTGGTHGSDGVNLFLYCTSIAISGNLHVDLRGGDGGDGGRGGDGGGGSTGTRVCYGGTGGRGANGSTGGNGGSGGTLTISCKRCPDLRAWLNDKITVGNYPGFPGLGGEGGFGGLAGLGVAGDTAKDGKTGSRGKKGQDGVGGNQGAINFEKN